MSPGQVRITAVIPVHNRADLLVRLLASMECQTVPFDETLVIDNASTDGAAEKAEARGCRTIRLGTNTGFAAAVNRGWREARGEWVAILNSDVELEPDWLEQLLGAAGDASFATGRILQFSHPETIDGTYDLLARSGCAWRAGNGERDAGTGRTEPARRIAIAPATACLFRRKVLEQLNGFEESFESYLEDVDLGLRCLAGGFTGVYVPAAAARHHGSATLGEWNPRVVRLIARNQLKLIARNYDAALFRECRWAILAGQFLWGLLAFRHGAGRAWVLGKRDGLRGFRPGGRPSPALRAFLNASEREIEDRAADAYWNCYFRCAVRRNDT